MPNKTAFLRPILEDKNPKGTKAAIAAMVASLDDPYSYYLDAETYTKFQENNEEEYDVAL